jgi:hypothetical protein
MMLGAFAAAQLLVTASTLPLNHCVILRTCLLPAMPPVTPVADFAPILRYVASQGTIAISMSAVASPKRLPDLLPKLRQQALPQTCHAVLAWQPAAGAAARKRLKQQQQQQQQQHEQEQEQQTPATGVMSGDVPQIASCQAQHPMVVTNSSSSSSSSQAVTTTAGRVILARSGWHAAPAPAAAAAVGQEGCPVQFIEAVWINPDS